LAHGVVAQETVGAVGLRDGGPHDSRDGRVRACDHASGARRVAHHLHQSGQRRHSGRAAGDGARAIGICDTPYEIFEDAAHALGLPATECAYDYFGLNPPRLLREVYHRGVPQMDRLWNDPARLESAYRDSLFETVAARENLRLLPSEYLYYYYRPETALEHLRRAGTSRGVHVARLTDALFEDLSRGVPDPVAR
jgi:6-phospho-beta-glucosidase